jgi:hypothetical protein
MDLDKVCPSAEFFLLIKSFVSWLMLVFRISIYNHSDCYLPINDTYDNIFSFEMTRQS